MLVQYYPALRGPPAPGFFQGEGAVGEGVKEQVLKTSVNLHRSSASIILLYKNYKKCKFFFQELARDTRTCVSFPTTS